MNLWNQPTEALAQALRSEGLARAYVITDPISGDVVPSQRVVESIARHIGTDTRDYRRHEGIFFEIGRESGHLLSACVHWTRRGQAAGGVRFWSYDTVEDFVRDGLRLARGMGQKCALAGLWWGGGKGVITRRSDRDHRESTVREAVYRDYGRFMTGLCGCYITAEDVGTRPDDMANVFATTRYTTCIPGRVGGSGNPSVLTGRGVVVAMEAALEFLGHGTLEGKTVAMQGLGNVATSMIGELIERKVGRVVGTDIDLEPVSKIQSVYPNAPLDLRVVERGDVSIFSQACDVFAPNAVGGTLNPDTISLIQAPVVCGAANNQLLDPERDDKTLDERGVLLVPDFLANRMGIVNCANEQYGVIDPDSAIDSHLDRDSEHGIFQRALNVFERSKASGLTTTHEAVALADELSGELHPIWGHRGQEIINHLVRSGWAEAEPVR